MVDDLQTIDETVPGFSGRLITPADGDYESARTIWNAMIDRRPSHIARCRTNDDVAAVLAWARAEGLEIAVRGGGHSIPGHSLIDDGVVIDLAPMNHVTVDADARLVRVGGGCLLGDVDAATQVHGLATPAGAISHTGAGGLILGGGLGWTMRKYGLTIDNLQAATVVLATGEVVTASADEHPDLFWALRGGGGNFGVVTEFVLTLHPRGPVYLAANAFSIEDAPVVLKAMAAFMPTADDDLVWSAFFRTLPDWPWAPPERVGEPVLLAPLAWLGDNDEGKEQIDQILLDLGVRPIAHGHGLIDYVDLQRLNDELNGHGHWNYHKSGFLAELDDDTIAVLVDRGARIASANSQLEVLSMGGRIARVDSGVTAFAHRHELWPVNVCGIWRPEESADDNIAWVKTTFDALTPHLRAGSYMNFGGSDAGGAEQRESYGDTWVRLREVKSQYDPGNVFRHNANVPPLQPEVAR